MFKMRLLNRHVSVAQHHPNNGIESSMSWVEVYKYPSSSSIRPYQYHNTFLFLPKITRLTIDDCGPWVSKTTRTTGMSLLRLVSKPTSRYEYFGNNSRFCDKRHEKRSNELYMEWKSRAFSTAQSQMLGVDFACRMLARRSSCAYKIFVTHSATVHPLSMFFSSSSKLSALPSWLEFASKSSTLTRYVEELVCL